MNFYLLQSGDIDNGWVENINKNLERFNSKLINLIIPDTDFPLHNLVLDRNPPLTQTSFYRYFIPELIQAERVLYLDTDTIVNDSLLPLFKMEMVGSPIYAVFDYLITHSYKGTHHYETFSEYDPHTNYQGGKDFTPYLNSGVLLLDIKICKLQNFTKRLILSTERYNKVRFGDQDIINFVFLKNWLGIDLKYNYQVGTSICYQDKRFLYPITEKPVVIHYTGSQKPWLKECQNRTPYHQLYWQYRNKPWEEIKPINE